MDNRPVNMLEYFMDNIFYQAPVGMAVADKDLKFVKVNRVFCDMLGYSKEEMVKFTFLDVTHPEDVNLDLKLARSLLLGKIPYYSIEKRYMTKKKKEIWVKMTAASIREKDSDGPYRFIIADNITKMKKAQAELERVMELKTFYVSMVSHELRGPLSVISNSLGLLADLEEKTMDEQSRSILDMAKRNTRKLAQLVDDILDLAKLEKKKMSFDFTANSIEKTIRDVYHTLGPVIEKEGLYFNMEIGENLPLAYFDKDKIEQVLFNLIYNAIKFTDKGGITAGASLAGKNIRVFVRDTGSGIPEKDISRAFEPFEQLLKGKKGVKGTGIGLTISRNIIEGHQGRMWVESIEGKGAAFYFTLPLRGDPREETGENGF